MWNPKDNLVRTGNGYMLKVPSFMTPIGKVQAIPMNQMNQINQIQMQQTMINPNQKENVSGSFSSKESTPQSSGPTSPTSTLHNQFNCPFGQIQPLPIPQVQLSDIMKRDNQSELKQSTFTSPSSSVIENQIPAEMKQTKVKVVEKKPFEKQSQSQRKQKETNLKLYTRLFCMWLLIDHGYTFIMKQKRTQTGKKVIYTISKILYNVTNETLVNRSERELFSKRLFPFSESEVRAEIQRKVIEKYVDEVIDNLLLDFLEICGYSLQSKESSIFKKALTSDKSMLEYKKYTLQFIEINDGSMSKKLSREDIYELYKDQLDEFARTLQFE